MFTGCLDFLFYEVYVNCCYFLLLFLFLFIYFWLCWVFVAACRLSLVAASGGYPSLWWLLLLWSTGSRHAGFHSCGSQALECWLRSCGARTSLLRGMWDLPGPGLEPVSPALAGRFLTTAPPRRSNYCYFEFFSISK